MYVKLGKYKDWWIGPYQIADSLKIFGYSEDECYEIGEKLESFPYLLKFCEWVYKYNPLKERKIVVKIDNFDVWNADNTMAIIIYPLLKEFVKDEIHSFFNVDDCDVPDAIKSMNAPRVVDYYDFDDNYILRHEWLMSELLWTFEQLQPDCENDASFYHYESERISDEYVWGDLIIDRDGILEYDKRIQNGLMLYGKYFRSLWT